jgi:hypothetical protein
MIRYPICFPFERISRLVDGQFRLHRSPPQKSLHRLIAAERCSLSRKPC